MNRAFVFTGMSFLMIIPAMIIAASFIKMQETGNEGVYVRMGGDKTFSVFENVDADLERVIELNGRRAAIGVVAYITNYGECLDNTTYDSSFGKGAEGAIKQLLIEGYINSTTGNDFAPEIMGGQTLDAWTDAFNNRTIPLGYNVSISISKDDIYIVPAPLTNWYYIYMTMNATINSSDGRFIYNGTIPRVGNITALVDGDGLVKVPDNDIFNCPNTWSW